MATILHSRAAEGPDWTRQSSAPLGCPGLSSLRVQSVACAFLPALSSAPFSPASSIFLGSGPLWTFTHLRDPSLCASVPLSGTQHLCLGLPISRGFCLLGDSVLRAPFSDLWICCQPQPCLPHPLGLAFSSVWAPSPHCLFSREGRAFCRQFVREECCWTQRKLFLGDRAGL